MTTKHTPGPWVVSDKTDQDCPIVLANGFRRIAKIHGVPGQLYANARLITAAPDMAVEISKQIDWLKHARAELQGVARESLLLGFDQSIKYLSAALAKARGEAV